MLLHKASSVDRGLWSVDLLQQKSRPLKEAGLLTHTEYRLIIA
jgi:hypothetical protein